MMGTTLDQAPGMALCKECCGTGVTREADGRCG